MINNNNGLNSLNERSSTNSSSLENLEENQQNSQEKVMVQGVEFTKEEIEEANKPQRNVILDTIGGSGIGTPDSDTDYRDNDRVNTRANEASDSTDTNTGGIASGGAKGANQS